MQLGFIGLGKMGSRMAGKLVENGHHVILWNRSSEPMTLFQQKHETQKEFFKTVSTIGDFFKELKSPRVFWLMLPTGLPTESILQELGMGVTQCDIIIDGGNSNYKDTQRRYEDFQAKGIRFLGIGVSGGIMAEKNGYPLMVGGDKSAYEEIIPILDTLAYPKGGHMYHGEGGAGHFVKMVHNGIEYGMMQAIGEGFGVLEKSPYKLDLNNVAAIWQNSTIISSFLIDCAKGVLEKDPQLSDIDGVIAETGEARWTVEAAKDEQVPVPIIEESLNFRTQSKIDKRIQNSYAAKMVAALRHQFGGHDVKKK